MRANAVNARSDKFALSGHDMQETFSDEKYKSLAAANKYGLALRKLVDAHWVEWLELVEKAPWLRNWVRSPLSKTETPATTPCGRNVEGLYTKHKIASAIFSNAVWGYGMLDWLNSPEGALVRRPSNTKSKSPGQYNAAMWCILDMQRVQKPNAARTWFWDEKIYRGCGVLVPCEFGELDRWLEPFWVEACGLVEKDGPLSSVK